MAQQIFTQRPKNAQEFLKQLEDLAKLNRQSQLRTGYETSSNTPYVLPGSQRVGTALEGSRNSQLTMPEVAGYVPEEIPTEQPSLTVDDFISQFTDSVTQSQTPQAIASTADGGTLYSDGRIRYSDGSVRQGDASAQPISSQQDGSVLYSDRSVRVKVSPVASVQGNRVQMSDGSILPNGFVEMLYGSGIEGISKGLFGTEQTVTQPYGNINPIEPTPGNVNYGTDLRTRDLPSKEIYFPVGAEVVQILEDDGTRFGDKSGHQGYGNSVLLRLSSGEMLRLSHLANLGDVQVGQSIPAGTYVGTTGQTGNTYGEHLDVEYYNPQGQIDDPKNFSGFTQPQTFSEQGKTNTLSSPSNPVKVEPQGQVLGASTSAPSMTPTQEFEAKPFANIDKPVTTSQQPSILESAATSIGAPEYGVSERAQANQVPFIAQAAGDLVDTGARALGIKTDFGVSELFTGGKPTVNTDQSLVGQAYADEGDDLPEYKEAQSFIDVLSNIGSKLGLGNVNTKLSSSEIPQAGEGLKGLQSPVSANIFQKPAVSSLALSSRIGEASAPASLDLAESPVSGQSAQINQAVKSPANPAQSPTPSAQIFSSSKSAPQASYGSSSSNQNVSRSSSQPSQSSQSQQSYPKQTNTSLNYTPAKPYTPAKVSTPAKTLNYTPAKPYTPNIAPAPVSQASAQVKPQSAPSSNIFSKAISAIKTIFRR